MQLNPVRVHRVADRGLARRFLRRLRERFVRGLESKSKQDRKPLLAGLAYARDNSPVK